MLNLKTSYFKGKGSLNLEQAQPFDEIEYQDLTDLKVEQIANRNTTYILKRHAIARCDQISALKFHCLEYNKHYTELKLLKNFSDKCILWFEKFVSNYGTNFFKAICYFIGINTLFILIYSCNLIPLPKNFNVLKTFIPFLSLAKIDVQNCLSTILLMLQALLNTALIYEIIKSFRKFSRNL